MAANAALLESAFVALAAIYAGFLFWGLRQLKPGLVMASVFFLVYFLARPLMLLSGAHGKFALLHAFPGAWSLDVLWRLWALTACMTIPYFAGYMVIEPRAIATRAVGIIASATVNVRAVIVIWVLALLTYVAGKVFDISVATLPYGFLMFGICMLLQSGKSGAQRGLSTMAGLVLTIVVLLCTEERRDWAVGVFVVGWALVFLRRRSLALRIGLGIGVLAIVAVAAIALRSAGKIIDRMGSSKQQLTALSLIEWDLDFPLVYDDLILLLQQVPSRHDYLYGESLSKPFVFWIPRELWPSKPETFSRKVSHEMNVSFYRGGGSEPLTFIGELYWNFGWLAILLAPLLGGAQRIIDEVYEVGYQMRGLWPATGNPVLAGGLVCAAMSFYVFRGPIDTVWLSFAGFAACIVAVRVVRRLV